MKKSLLAIAAISCVAAAATAYAGQKVCHYELRYASASTKASYPATETRTVSSNTNCPPSWTVSDNGWTPTGVYIFTHSTSH